MKALVSFLASVLLMSAVHAQVNNPSGELISVSVTKAYLPQGYDNNDAIKLVVEGDFPSTCYKLGKTEVKVDEATKQIEVRQYAYLYLQSCVMMIVPYYQTVEVGFIRESGQYQVKDATNQNILGTLPVALSRTSGPDDHYYAIVNEAVIKTNIDGKKVAILEGILPNRCWKVTEKKALMDGADIVTVLPIMENNAQSDCGNIAIPFIETVALPNLSNGRYLLNVRTLNGGAIHKIFSSGLVF